MKKINIIFVAMFIAVLFSSQGINAHCEIPCGIYADSVRIILINEHITTIEKSMNSIIRLSGKEQVNQNQLVRWIMNKEEHAKKIQNIVSQYFLHQRIKLVDSSNKDLQKIYFAKLAKLHEILVFSMKAKQSTDLSIIGKLKSAVEEFSGMYFHKH